MAEASFWCKWKHKSLPGRETGGLSSCLKVSLLFQKPPRLLIQPRPTEMSDGRTLFGMALNWDFRHIVGLMGKSSFQQLLAVVSPSSKPDTREERKRRTEGVLMWLEERLWLSYQCCLNASVNPVDKRDCCRARNPCNWFTVSPRRSPGQISPDFRLTRPWLDTHHCGYTIVYEAFPVRNQE
jgi:hypothetical protein